MQYLVLLLQILIVIYSVSFIEKYKNKKSTIKSTEPMPIDQAELNMFLQGGLCPEKTIVVKLLTLSATNFVQVQLKENILEIIKVKDSTKESDQLFINAIFQKSNSINSEEIIALRKNINSEETFNKAMEKWILCLNSNLLAKGYKFGTKKNFIIGFFNLAMATFSLIFGFYFVSENIGVQLLAYATITFTPLFIYLTVKLLGLQPTFAYEQFQLWNNLKKSIEKNNFTMDYTVDLLTLIALGLSYEKIVSISKEENIYFNSDSNCEFSHFEKIVKKTFVDPVKNSLLG